MADISPPAPPTAVNPDPVLAEPFRWEGWHVGVRLPGGRGLFSTRRGGASEGSFESLNLSRTVGDQAGAVRANRERLAAQLDLPWDRVCHGRQVHGVAVRRAEEPPSPLRPIAEEDGQATALDDAAALVFVADCLPILLFADGAVAALHGGWRGLAGGIVAEGVRALRDCGASGSIAAALGPCARGCCYEVGEEVQAHFSQPGARRGDRGLELAAVARAELGAAGVAEVHDVGLCTMCSPALFFSHRRDDGTTGRQAGMAWRAA